MMKAIRGQDIFGHSVTWLTAAGNPTHQTFIGGIFSIIMKSLILVLIIIRSKIIFERSSASLNTSSDHDEPGKNYKYSELGIVFPINIVKGDK